MLVSVRPEEFVLTEGDTGMSAVIEDSAFLGLNTQYFARLSTGESVTVVQESTFDGGVNNGETVNLAVKAQKINVFTADGQKTLIDC